MQILFLDDERTLDQVTWIQYPSGITTLTTVRDYFDFRVAVKQLPSLKNILFSFDHDLQCFEDDKEYTGLDCAKFLIEYIMDNPHLDPNDLNYIVHSKNPCGKLNIESYINTFINMYTNENISR